MSDPALQGVPDFDRFEIVKSAKSTIASFSSPATHTETIAHNLGYVPVPFVYIDDGSKVFALPTIIGYNLGTPTANFVGVTSFMYFAADATNLYIYYAEAASGTSLSYPFKYYLCRQKTTR